VRTIGGTSRVVAVAAALALGVLLASWVAISRADYQGPDENMSQAFGPLKGNFTYAAQLNGANDVDWYFFYVPTAGDHLHWAVNNTTPTGSCVPPGVNECNMYATLIDQNGKQVGGDNSSAGTAAVPAGGSDKIDWTFAEPGKYFLLIQQDGDGPSYSFNITPASGLSTSPPGSQSPSATARALQLSAKQGRGNVRVGVLVPDGVVSLQARLTLNGFNAGRVTLRHVSPGHVHFKIPFTKATAGSLKRRHRLTLTLTVRLLLTNSHVERATRKLTVTG
jgi:hypothetical protein